MSACDIRRDVLLRAVHHCHRTDGREVSSEEERETRARRGSEDAERGRRMLYTITRSWGLFQGSVRKQMFDYRIRRMANCSLFPLSLNWNPAVFLIFLHLDHLVFIMISSTRRWKLSYYFPM